MLIIFEERILVLVGLGLWSRCMNKLLRLDGLVLFFNGIGEIVSKVLDVNSQKVHFNCFI